MRFWYILGEWSLDFIYCFRNMVGIGFVDFVEGIFLEFGESQEYRDRVKRESSLVVERSSFAPEQRGFNSPLSREP